MGNTPSKIAGRIKLIWKRLCSVFSAALKTNHSSPDETSVSGQNHNRIPPESQEAILQPNDCSTAEDGGGPVLEAETISDFLSDLGPEALSHSPIAGFQTGPAGGTSSSGALAGSDTAFGFKLQRPGSVSNAQTNNDSSSDMTSISNQDTNVTVPSEPQEAILSRNNSPTADDGDPIPEVTPGASSNLSHIESTSESSNVGSSQTGLVQEQSSDDPGNDSGRSSEHSLKPDITFPEVTISAFTETGQAESSIEVPLQRASTGRAPIILSILADIPCATLGILGILDRLNTILGTSHTLDIPSLYSLLEECILNNYDFGMAYCRLCRMWYTSNWSTIRDKLRRHEEEDWERRQKALDGNQIVDPRLPPRRVWDLYGNRVVPYWIAHRCPTPISHAWMDEKDRIHTWTPTNGYEWPVPIPKDANLKLIWIEMLNLGLEYVWLDALCLRQVGGPGEDIRAEEWKLDVPTIGQMYVGYRTVVIYLSGLGQPLSLKEGEMDSNRSWFRRAWTLQEIGDKWIIAGDTPDGPLHAHLIRPVVYTISCRLRN